MTVCGDAANAYAGPGKDYQVLEQSSSDWKWDVFGKVDDWYYLGHDEKGNHYFMHESTLCELPSN